ncbi:uncharacterized protein LOC121151877 [Ochotona curzoniae]|uniref:uncharacterized protein LOC121151877 n=1 Tax=Ochotona curzoniae TaxID=130825 RepID=UPI001B3505F8|nr:uncharacterized protein LOC121151877 [Ochotona curzoniae]
MTEGVLGVSVEEYRLNISIRLEAARASVASTISLEHTFPQLWVLPGELVLQTAYRRTRGARELRQTLLWDGREVALSGSLSGLFLKPPGNLSLQGVEAAAERVITDTLGMPPLGTSLICELWPVGSNRKQVGPRLCPRGSGLGSDPDVASCSSLCQEV